MSLPFVLHFLHILADPPLTVPVVAASAAQSHRHNHECQRVDENPLPPESV